MAILSTKKLKKVLQKFQNNGFVTSRFLKKKSKMLEIIAIKEEFIL